MNKMKKLLSVLLAVLMILSSMTVMASAAKTNYKTVEELTALDAYSPYGQVTRLSTEERMSMIFDVLDNLLATANINMGKILDVDLWVTQLELTVDLTSVDALCATIDEAYVLLEENGLVSLVKGALGVLADAELQSWQTGMTREGTDQLTIVQNLAEVLADNEGLVNTVISTGELDLGLISSLAGLNLDLSIIADIPGLIKGMIFPMLERWDDTKAEIQALETAKKGDGGVESTLNNFVKNLFTNDMSITTVKADANGTTTSEHNLPGANADARVRYTVSGTTLTATTYATQTYVDEQAKLGVTVTEGSYYVTAKYILEEEWGTGDHVWARVEIDEDGNIKYDDDGVAIHVGENLKYYELDSQLLPSLTATIDLENMSLADLLYTFIPPVFGDMAPVVLNGSLKKILGGFFGAKYNYVGLVGDAAVTALAESTGDAFFTEEQGEYLWEWSNYAVIDGNHYYRFEDQIFEADLSSVNNYFHIINWDYEIKADFMDEFIPTNPSTDSTLLMNLNNFLIKVAEEITVASATTVNALTGYTKEWTRPTFTKGDNSNLVANIKAAAQAVISLAPQSIFGSDYDTNDRCYYNLLMSDDNDTILTGIAAMIVDLVMPSMTLPGASKLVESKAKVGAILAAVIREFAAYLVPEYNYDALIYADFGTTTNDPDKTFIDPEAAGLVTEGQTVSGYWLDVIMTMALDVGYEYIRAFADMGEDTDLWSSFVSYSGYGVDGKTYAAGTKQATLNAQWEGMLDYVVDWALSDDYEWTWKMEKLVDTTGLTIDLATAQDPWVKLDKILNDLLPADEILNVTATDCETELEQMLRYNLILAIVDLRWEDLADMLKVPNGFVRNTNVLDSLATVLKNLINGLFAKVGGGSYAFIPATITDFDTLANQANLATMVSQLVGALDDAYNNGLLDVVLPFVNMFLGWKTDPQVIADPSIYLTNRDGEDYSYVYGTTIEQMTLNFVNNSAGMLETHRDTTTVDHAYEIQLISITSDAKYNTLNFDLGDKSVMPYETQQVAVTGTYTQDEAVTIVVAYNYVGKDGQPVGGTQYTSIRTFISNLYADSKAYTAASEKDDNTWRDGYYTYIFTEDIYNTIVNNASVVWYNNGNALWSATSNVNQYQAPAQYGVVDDNGTTDCEDDDTTNYYDYEYPSYNEYADDGYFTYRTQEESDWAAISSQNENVSDTGYFFKEGTVKPAEGEDYPYGNYAFQKVLVTYGSSQKTFDYTFIHYDDYDFASFVEPYNNMNITINDVNQNDAEAVAAYNTFNEALKNAVKLATYPLMTTASGASASVDYVKAIMPQIEPAREALETAYENLEGFMAEATSSAGADATLPKSVQDLEAQLALDDGDGEKEVNFQDYEYYEYFNYADLRTEARNYVKGYYAPEVMDEHYILNSGIREAELKNVIAAEPNATKAAAIEATKLENDPQAVADSKAAYDAFVMPNDSDLLIQDMTARLAYYKTFLAGKEENADHLYFLNLEIAHVEAQQLIEENYEANTWAAYAEALATAKAVAAGNDEYASYNSRIYEVKYNLMVAYKNLLLKSDSLIEAGGTADLLANIEIAESILAMSLDEITLSETAIEKGLTKEQALGHLIQGLGYYYVGEDGNEWNLYADSAYEYADNDRPNRASNQAKVNAANNNLDACIKYFELAEAEPNTIMLKEDAPHDRVVFDLVNTCDGEFTGSIYGIETLGYNDSGEVEGALADFLTTAYGDDYLEIIPADGGETTGTLINALDEEGNVVETYVFVYFGDIDMDGAVGASDAFYAENYEINYEGIDTLYQFMAGDLDGDGMPGASDAFIMENYEINYEGMPEQADVAEIASGNEYSM